VKALRPKPAPGRPPMLTPRQQRRLLQLLVKGPLSEGHATDLWTLPRIATLIGKHFGTRYHPGHVWRVMRGLGWTCQKPERRALQRDENAIARWKTRAWPRIKKAQRLGAHLVFLDESGFLLIPNVRKTWAPIGQTPLFKHSYRRDRMSVISSITVSPAGRSSTRTSLSGPRPSTL